jgi:hypothetical protein
MFTDLLREGTYTAYRVRCEALLQIPTNASPAEISSLIKAGFSDVIVNTMRNLCTGYPLELNQKSWAGVSDTPSPNRRLTVPESEYLFRCAHIIALAESLFEDKEKAQRWLLLPKDRFSGKCPFQVASTVEGTQWVETLLIQGTEGFVA